MIEQEDIDIAKNENENSLDETMHLFVYGNIKIVDKETGEVLVNKPF